MVYVPRIHYRHGYDVAVKGAVVKSSKPRSRYLRLVDKPGAGSVSLDILPTGGVQ